MDHLKTSQKATQAASNAALIKAPTRAINSSDALQRNF
jgi:hypothetical protein